MFNQSFGIHLQMSASTGGFTGPMNAAARSANMATGSFSKVQKQAKATSASLQSLAGAFTSIVVASHIKGAITAMVKPAIDMEMALSRLKTLTRATKAEMKLFEQEAIKAAQVTPYGPQEAVETLVRLRQATGSASAAVKALTPTLTLAMASFGKMTPEAASKMMGDMIRAWGMTGDQAEIAADQVYNATRTMGIGIEELSKTMGDLRMAGVAGGQGFSEMMKAMILTKRVMRSPERAATRLTALMSNLSTLKAEKGFKSIGVDTRSGGKVRAFSDIMTDLANRYETGSVGVRQMLSSSGAVSRAAARPLLAILSQLSKGIPAQMEDGTEKILKGAEAYKYLTKSITNSGGALDEARKNYLETVGASLEIMQENLTVVGMELSKRFLPILQAVADGLKSFASAVKALTGDAMMGPILRWVAAFAMLRSAWFAIKAALSGAKRIFMGVVQEMGATARAANSAAAAVNNLAAANMRLAGGRVAGVAGSSAVALSGSMTPGAAGNGVGAAMMGATLGAGAVSRLGAGGMPAAQAVKNVSLMGRATAGAAKVANTAMRGLGKSVGLVSALIGGWPGLIMAAIVFLPELQAAFEKVRKMINPMTSEQEEAKRIKYFKQVVARGRPNDVTGYYAKEYDNAQKHLDAYNKRVAAADKEKKVAEIMQLTGKQLYSHMQLGSDAMNKSLDRIEKLSKYTPPQIKYEAFQAIEQKMLKSKGVGTDFDKANTAMGLRAAKGLRRLVHIGSKRVLRPEEQAQKEALALMFQQAAGHMMVMGIGGVSKGEYEKYNEQTVSELAKVQSAANREASGMGFRGRGGMMPHGSTYTQQSGWAGHLGGLMPHEMMGLPGPAEMIQHFLGVGGSPMSRSRLRTAYGPVMKMRSSNPEAAAYPSPEQGWQAFSKDAMEEGTAMRQQGDIIIFDTLRDLKEGINRVKDALTAAGGLTVKLATGSDPLTGNTGRE